jgi:type IV pilus assembly protein PilV
MIELEKNCTAHRREDGFSLVEVLIALIIMSVGMLGIASLYVQSMQAGRTSLFRHNAVTLAGDVADRIRANPTAVGAYALAGADNQCVGMGITCSNVQMAAHDIFLWNQQAANTLPAGNVVVTVDATVAPPMYTITVNWNEPGLQQSGPPPSYSVTTPIPTF